MGPFLYNWFNMFYLINKEKGISSFKAINNFARENNIKKIGHTGTLDPLATGLLLVATDDDTKLIDYIDKGSKSYIVELELGKVSDTYDSEGEVQITNVDYDASKVKDVIMSFVKTYDQMPPSFSAKKINGKKAYELAREGKEVILKPKQVTISNIKDINIEGNKASFELEVSRGTYIRSIVHEIGQELGCGAIMTELQRNKVAGLSLNNINSEINELELIKLPTLSKFDPVKLLNGIKVSVDKNDGQYALTFKNKVIGIGTVSNNVLKSNKILGNKLKELMNEGK